MTEEQFWEDFSDWKTPQAWSNIFGDPPDGSGVYVFVRFYGRAIRFCDILYIGSSKNLHKRCAEHEMWDILKGQYEYFMFFWREEEKYISIEKKLIKKYKPLFNKNGKRS